MQYRLNKKYSVHIISFSIGRMILTKKPWIFDPNGDRDRDDITDEYKNKEGNDKTFNRTSLYEDNTVPQNQ
jgi:hypothetical protein